MCCGGQGCSGVPLRSLHSKEQKHLSGAACVTPCSQAKGGLKNFFKKVGG